MTRAPNLDVELPAGGRIHLQSIDEVERWNALAEGYMKDYRLTKVNDLTNLGTLLTHHMTLYRAQRTISGMEPQFDEDGLPTGQLVKADSLTEADKKRAADMMNKASQEIRQVEVQMGIDKKSREQSGPQTVQNYIERLKRVGYQYAVHVNQRVHRYEEFVNELSWRLRLEQNGDAEDRAYHDCTPDKILAWAREEIELLRAVDREFAQERQKLVVGTL